MNPFDYQHDTPQAQVQLVGAKAGWQRYSVHFVNAQPNRFAGENNGVRGEYYRPLNSSRAPLLILVHGMGDASVIPCRLLAHSLVKKEVACFVLYLVLHSSRIPESVKQRLPNLSADEWFESYRVSVNDIRRVLDWAGERTDIDKQRMVVLGISLGGFTSAIAMGIDNRIKAGVFVVMGGNSEKMAWLSRSRTYHEGYQRSEAEYRQLQESYAQYLTEVNQKGLENVTPAHQSYLTDPMTFAGFLKDRPVLMINARHDKYIPQEATLDFWRACGQPEIKWFPTGHASLWLCYPAINRQVTRFLTSALEVAGPGSP